MDHVWEDSPSAIPPSPPDNPKLGYPSELDSPTQPGAWYFHMITEEIRNAIVAGGLSPDAKSVTQLAEVITNIINNAPPVPDLTPYVKKSGDVMTGALTMSGGARIALQSTKPTGFIGSADDSRGYGIGFFAPDGTTEFAWFRYDGATSFLQRPTWQGGLVPWDSGNFNPATKADASSVTNSVTNINNQLTGKFYCPSGRIAPAWESTGIISNEVATPIFITIEGVRWVVVADRHNKDAPNNKSDFNPNSYISEINIYESGGGGFEFNAMELDDAFVNKYSDPSDGSQHKLPNIESIAACLVKSYQEVSAELSKLREDFKILKLNATSK